MTSERRVQTMPALARKLFKSGADTMQIAVRLCMRKSDGKPNEARVVEYLEIERAKR